MQWLKSTKAEQQTETVAKGFSVFFCELPKNLKIFFPQMLALRKGNIKKGYIAALLLLPDATTFALVLSAVE